MNFEEIVWTFLIKVTLGQNLLSTESYTLDLKVVDQKERVFFFFSVRSIFCSSCFLWAVNIHTLSYIANLPWAHPVLDALSASNF